MIKYVCLSKLALLPEKITNWLYHNLCHISALRITTSFWRGEHVLDMDATKSF